MPAAVPAWCHAQEGLGHLARRFPRLASGNPFDIADFGAGEAIPPLGQGMEPGRKPFPQGEVAPGRGLLFQPRVEPEDLVHQLDQLVDPVVVDAILDGGKLAELPAEAENVPGIDHRPALDRAVQEILDLRRQRRRLIRLAALDRQVGRGQPAVDLTPHPGGGHGHDLGLFDGRLHESHAGKQAGQVNVL